MDLMNAVVVYESHWGNTAAVARAIAAGIGPETQVLTTDEATASAIASADLIVAGAPVIAFGLPGARGEAALKQAAETSPTPPDLSHSSLRSWLDRLPAGHGAAAAFETRVRWSPGGATGTIEKRLAAAGYQPIAKGGRFLVAGQYGPLRDGELDKATEFGRRIAVAAGIEPAAAAAR
jgi:flavorubredoxin